MYNIKEIPVEFDELSNVKLFVLAHHVGGNHQDVLLDAFHPGSRSS